MPTLTTLVNFNGTDGQNPFVGLIADAAGNLFGTTSAGGPDGDGTVFEIAKTGGYASTPTTLASFNATNGYEPLGGLIADAAGDLFGTTIGGGANGDFGTVFEIAKTTTGYASTPTTLESFNGTNGSGPAGSLIADAAGDLFGTTAYGGPDGYGTVFEIAKTGGSYASTLTILASFNSTDGAYPDARLIADAAGDLFGTTTYGGPDNDGTVFEIVKTGGSYASTPTTLVSFNGTNGEVPYADLIADAAGNLFGTTTLGGAYGYGTVFEIAKTGGSYASMPTTLASFNSTDGAFPDAGLIADAAGDLFGTTEARGANGDGTVFEIAKTTTGYASTPTTLESFNGSNGSSPYGDLIADAAGDLFGTTAGGGANLDGTVFELTGTGFAGPILSGGGNSVNYAPQGAAVAVDAGLGVSDVSSATLAGATVDIRAGFLAGDTLNFANQSGIAGSYDAGTGVLTLTGSASLANYQAALESITFDSTSGNPSDSGADPSRTVSWTVTDGTLSSNTIASTIDIAAFAIDDLTTGVQSLSEGTPYTGPVAGLVDQYINTSPDNLNIAALVANTFIHAGSGEDAIDVSHVGGTNVLDGGDGGSKFLVGGTGPSSFDTFFVEDSNFSQSSSDIWSTVVNFHAGDAATIFGITQNGFNTAWVDGQGAAGYTWLTLHVTAPGVPTASLTLSGYTTADLTNGTLTTSYGIENNGTPYLYVRANS